MDEIIKVAERYCNTPYASDVRPGGTTDSTSSTSDVSLVTKEEVGKALKGMKIGEAAVVDGITVDLEGGKKHCTGID